MAEYLRALTDAATSGPWLVVGDDRGWAPVNSRSAQINVVGTVRRRDAEFIAAARNSVPDLLDRVDAAETKLAAIEHIMSDEWLHGRVLPAMVGYPEIARARAVRDVLTGDTGTTPAAGA